MKDKGDGNIGAHALQVSIARSCQISASQVQPIHLHNIVLALTHSRIDTMHGRGYTATQHLARKAPRHSETLELWT